VDGVRDMLESPNEAMIEDGREQARQTTYLGAGCTVLLLLIYCVGAAANRETEDSFTERRE
jgi:hypothetical protein